MKPLLALVLILSVVSLTGAEPISRIASVPISGTQLSALIGAGFGGGAVCGIALGAAVIAGLGIAAAATAGTSLPFSVCLGFSLAVHIDAICLLLD
jgi:hypothetical protein